MKTKLAITIPVLNEEETIVSKVEEVVNFFNLNNICDYIIIIGDNGSTDNTENLSKSLEQKYDFIKYLKISRKGVGLALRESWLKYEADIVGYMDLDLATDLKHIFEVLKLFENEDTKIVVGSRLLKSSKVSNRKPIREITSRGFNFLVKRILKVKFTDGMCGFKFFRREIAVSLIKKGIETDGWIFATEILAKAEWSGIKIKEVAVNWKDDPNSKVKILSLSWAYFKHLISLRKERKDWLKK